MWTKNRRTIIKQRCMVIMQSTWVVVGVEWAIWSIWHTSLILCFTLKVFLHAVFVILSCSPCVFPLQCIPSIFFFFFFASPCSMWDLSSLTRDRTCAPALEDRVLTTGPPGRLYPASSLSCFIHITCLVVFCARLTFCVARFCSFSVTV